MITTYRALWFSLAGIILSLLSYFLLGLQATVLWLNLVVFGVAVAACLAWFPAVISAFRGGARSAANKITISIWAVWAVLTVQRFYALVLLALTVTVDGKPVRPQWLVESPVQPMIITLVTLAGLYATFATVSTTEGPNTDRGWTILSAFVGGIVAGGVAVYLAINGLNFN